MNVLSSHFAIASALIVVFNGCSGSTTSVDIRDGVVYCTFVASETEQKIGTVSDDQVTVFATFGGQVLPLSEVRGIVAKVDVDESETRQSVVQLRALQTAFYSHTAIGIWLLKSRKQEGLFKIGTKRPVLEEVIEDDPNYLILRSDNTFRICQTDVEYAGEWEVDSRGEIQLKSDGAGAAEALQSVRISTHQDSLFFTLDVDDAQMILTYERTDLPNEPKSR